MRSRRALFALGLCSVMVACGAFSGDDLDGEADGPSMPDAGVAVETGAEAATPLPSLDGGLPSTCPNPLPSSTSAYRAAVAADCPRAYFPLDDAKDAPEAKNVVGNPGALISRSQGAQSQIVLGAPGRVGTSAAFGGLNEGLSFGIAFASSDVFTLEALVRPSMPNGSQPLFLDLDASAALGFKLTLTRRDATLDAVFFVSERPMVSRTATASADLTVAPNTLDLGWHHVAAVVDASSIRVYLDGIENSIPSDGVRPGVSGVPLSFGNFFTGSLDEVAVYDRALTKAQVASHVAKLP